MSTTILTTARAYPKHPYETIKNAVLGKSYTLTLVFTGATRAQALNKAHRGATYVPNVLSFPLDAHNGEIYITPTVARREAKKFDMTYEGYVGFLFIHGLLHLKGHDHGATMEKAERLFVRKFNLR